MTVYSFDVNKVRILLHYLGVSHEKVHERDIAREKLKASFIRLKALSSKKVLSEVHQLEKNLKDALVKEKKILTVQARQDKVSNDLHSKIDKLHDHIEHYMAHRNARDARLRSIEQKIFSQVDPKEYKAIMLKEKLWELTQFYEREKKSGKYTKRDLDGIARRLKRLKTKLKKMSHHTS